MLGHEKLLTRYAIELQEKTLQYVVELRGFERLQRS